MKLTKELILLSASILASCGSNTSEPTPPPPQPANNPVDTAVLGDWSQWQPANNTNTSVIDITQTRNRSCQIIVNGSQDNPAPTCSGNTTETRTFTNPLATDTATWSQWSQWQPANNTNTSVIDITQTRKRSCNITVIGNTDTVAATCTGNTSETKTITNPLAADTATWSQWSPANNTDTSVIDIIQTRECAVTVIGNADSPAATCADGANHGDTQTQMVENPLAADTAAWSAWSDWLPANNTDTNIIEINQSRTRICKIMVIGNIDDPEPSCIGNNSETRTAVNPLSAEADIATWSAWTPTLSPANTSSITISQTRACIVAVKGDFTDDPAPTCSGGNLRTITNTFAADTANWSEWTPTLSPANTSSITITQIRVCIIVVNGDTDSPAPTCSGGNSQTITNTFAADTATWSAWSQWSPTNNTNTSVIEITQSRTRSCGILIIGNTDTITPPAICSGNASETRIITNPLAADMLILGAWGQWLPTSTADTNNFTFIQTRVRDCEVAVIGNTDNPALTCSTSQTRSVRNFNFVAGLAANGVTIVCDSLGDNVSFNVNGSTYTKRSRGQINAYNADNADNAATSCTSGITDMNNLFANDNNFNADISHWDTSSVVNMSNMFTSAIAFNRDISNWDTSSVSNMDGMFDNATAFKQDLSGWCVSLFSNAPPANFDAGNSGLALNTANHPNWGSCLTATNQQIVIQSGFSRSFTLEASDTDGDALIYTIGSTTTDGVVSLTDNQVVYTPNANYIGIDSFSYEVTDGSSTKTAIVALTVSNSIYLANAGLTIDCSSVNVGTTFTLGITTYTKRSKGQITTGNAATSCTSGITDMSNLFANSATFNADISHWDTSSVINMSAMFNGASAFNQAIGVWDTSSVIDMSAMFYSAADFNQAIGTWDTSSVIDMSNMFRSALDFNQAIGVWDTSSVINMSNMFRSTTDFNQAIGAWDTSSVTDMSRMFTAATQFNQAIGNWDTSSVINMFTMFSNSANFNQAIGNWDTSSVTNMRGMFEFTSSFNQDLSGWCVSRVTSYGFFNSFANKFLAAKPNWEQPCLSGNGVTLICAAENVGDSFTISVNGSTSTFTKRSKSQISTDNAAASCTSGITDMSNLFRVEPGYSGTITFNEDISHWDTSSVTNTNSMFLGASAFNQDIGNWDTSSITDMAAMFNLATTFNRDLSGWCVSQIVSVPTDFATGATAFNSANHPSWGDCPSSSSGSGAGKIINIPLTIENNPFL